MTRRPRRALAALAGGLALACSAPPPADTGPAVDPDRVSWAGPVDFTDLRTKYGDRDDFDAVCQAGRPLRELFEAASRDDWDTVLAVSAPWLLDCPVDIDVHALRAVACRETGRPVDAYHHQVWFQGLVDSVLDSGEGDRADPFVVISVEEEYSVLRALQLEHEEQRLVEGGIDAITARDPAGERVTVHFFPEAHWRRLMKAYPDAEAR